MRILRWIVGRGDDVDLRMLEVGCRWRGEERAERRTLTLKEVAEEGVAIIREVVPLVMEGLRLSSGVLALLAVEPCIDEHGVSAEVGGPWRVLHLRRGQEERANAP